MKKKILFGITSLKLGGAERVLVDIVNNICDKYDITILTMYGHGEFESELNKKEHELYEKTKKIFDPNGFMNPETKLGATFADVVRHLRTSETQGVK